MDFTQPYSDPPSYTSSELQDPQLMPQFWTQDA